MRAFIIRPFGVKPDRRGVDIDFDHVEDVLIAPALEALGYEGRTTAEIAEAGNIRADMFRLLVTADLVVADLSIHNANVFYELGIRHALRDKRTFLIRCKGDDTIFDLQTDRYLEYDRSRPEEGLGALIRGLRQTRDNTKKDSPVFLLLPDLQVQRRSLFLTVPPELAEAVERAEAEGRSGDLGLLAAEARGAEWESEGLRLIGHAQVRDEAYEGARVTWDAVRKLDGEALDANTQLGTIHQRLGDLLASDQALRRALASRDVTEPARAELFALLGRNAKANWIKEWEHAPEGERRHRALRSAWLEASASRYADGFSEDLNHFYSGLNALAMLTILVDLASALPDVWADRFGDDDEAERELKERAEQTARLAAAVKLSIEAEHRQLQRVGGANPWVAMSEADLALLTVATPRRVAGAYRRALVGAPPQVIRAARNQLLLYRELGVRGANLNAVLEVFPTPVSDPAPPAVHPRVLLFAGHMIDAPRREQSRFPAEQEQVARRAIHDAVARELDKSEVPVRGIASGASGGDILFHEVCDELGIPTDLYLALPPDQFIATSVSPAGRHWVDRFYRVHDRLPRRVLQDGPELPAWIREKRGYGIWQRANLWMLYSALDLSPRVTLIALWDGEGGDAPGGTEHMVATARARGAELVILDTRQLFEGPPPS
jgi:hypothetical protein